MTMHCPICLKPLKEIGQKGLFWSLKNGIIYCCETCNAEITISVEYYSHFELEDDEDDEDDEIMEKILKFMKAENEAFKREGIEEGTVVFTCPICGGEAVGKRYRYGSRISGLGSGCTKCGISHT